MPPDPRNARGPDVGASEPGRKNVEGDRPVESSTAAAPLQTVTVVLWRLAELAAWAVLAAVVVAAVGGVR